MFKSYSWEIKSDLDKILKKYLGETRIKFFVEKVLFSSREPHIPLTGGHLHQPDDLKEATFSLTNVRLNFDHVIAFTEKILTKKKHLNLMLDLGKLSFQLGELNLASEICSQLLFNTIGRPEFRLERASAYTQIFRVYGFQAKWREAFSYGKQAKNLLRLPEDLKDMAYIENVYGALNLEKGDLNLAFKHFNASLDLIKGKKMPEIRAIVTSNLGIYHIIRGDLKESLVYHRSALERFKKDNDNVKITKVHNNIGMVYFKGDNYDKSLKEFHKALAIARACNDIAILAIVYVNMAHVHIKMGDLISATKLLERSFEIGNELNDRLTIADTYKLKGVIERIRKNYELAENLLKMSYRLNNEINNKLNFAESNFELGVLYTEIKKNEEAKEYFQVARKHFNKIGAKLEIKEINTYLKQLR